MARRPELSGSFWPSATQELLLQAALLPDERAESAWLALRPHFDIERLERGSLAVLPLLYQRLAQRRLADPVVARLRGVFRYTWTRTQVALDSLTTMLAALQASGLDCVLLGDAALVTGYYRRPGDRALDEPAVLVEPHAIERGRRTLEKRGWRLVASRSHGVLLTPPGTAWPPYRLVTRVLTEDVIAAPPESLWRSRRAATVGHVQTAALGPTHELLRTCLLGARTPQRIVWVADATAIVRGAADEIDWDELVHDAARLRMAPRLHDGLTYLSRAMRLEIPPTAIAQLAAEPVTRREALAHRLSGRGGHVLGNTPAIAATHLIATQRQSPLRALGTLPRFLAGEWGLDRTSALPVAIARRAARALAAASTRGRPSAR
ncbi:MAG TPA: nucleotidyltransferase family protein [Gaiellaceae bacterium]|nr:nucleotidyltransferase family protein [Gaiellaceae bacterium]